MQTAAEAKSKKAAAADGVCKPPPRQGKNTGGAHPQGCAPSACISNFAGEWLRGALAGEAAAGAFCAAGAGHFQNQKNGALWRSPALRGYGGFKAGKAHLPAPCGRAPPCGDTAAKIREERGFACGGGAAFARPKISPFCGGGRRWRGTAPRTAPCSPPESPPSSAARW